ncbi:peptidase, partial [candidate division KSB1 bacterium]|nr:peptidase [candidate division KSB1 bacterium]
MKSLIWGVLIMTAAFSLSCGSKSAFDVNAELAKLAPVSLETDLDLLPISEKKCLGKLVEASHIIDDLFLLQVNENNVKIREEISSTGDQPVLELFDIMFGPWNRLTENKPFYGSEEKPLGAAFYPADMSKEEFKNFIAANPDQEKAFTSEFTVIRRIDSVLT